MNNYIEELSHGDCFELLGNMYIVTCDQKNDGRRLCVDIKAGNMRWFKGSDIINNKIPIFYTNEDNHIVAIRETSKISQDSV